MKSKKKISMTYRIAIVGVLTALYVVMSAFLKIPIVGHIVIDLGYIVFAIALEEFGVYGAFVGAVGCAIESMLFDGYGFSVSWFVGNLIIGIGCGLCFVKLSRMWQKIISVVIFVFLGMFCAKTVIDCAMYSIPLVAKIPKSATAFCLDSTGMIIGLLLWRSIKGRFFAEKETGRDRQTRGNDNTPMKGDQR